MELSHVSSQKVTGEYPRDLSLTYLSLSCYYEIVYKLSHQLTQSRVGTSHQAPSRIANQRGQVKTRFSFKLLHPCPRASLMNIKQ